MGLMLVHAGRLAKYGAEPSHSSKKIVALFPACLTSDQASTHFGGIDLAETQTFTSSTSQRTQFGDKFKILE
jgi:hypothetical protein